MFFTVNVVSSQLKPFLEIIEQPQKMFRFRYERELQKGKHGSIVGVKSKCKRKTSQKNMRKTFPAVKLHNFNDSSKVIIRCSLYQIEKGQWREPHPHKLIFSGNGIEKTDVYDVALTNDFKAS
jgi:hypothetical protein